MLPRFRERDMLMADLPKVLFVCVENSNRSQMAEGFARIHGAGQVEPYSAGSKPSGKVNPKAIAAMQEIGYDLTTHTSKSLDDVPDGEYAAVITMGCGEACPSVPAAIHEDWEIPDPRDMSDDEFRGVRELISGKVRVLLTQI